MSVPIILERYSSLLSVLRQSGLNDIKKRKVSASLRVSTAPSAAEFVVSKIEDISLIIEYIDEMRKGLNGAFDDGNLPVLQYTEAIEDVEKYSKLKERELVMLKRQKKSIKDDLEENVPSHARLEDAYANIIMNKVMTAATKQKKKKYNQSAFKKRVIAFYGAEQDSENDGDIDSLWCHLTGWQALADVKAAHIVPKSLESTELSYLFGAGEVMLSDANNGLTLHRNVEAGLDSGKIVLLPLPPTKGEDTKWKCCLTDKKIGNKMVYSGIKWRDIDGKQLEFLTANRPARRYLYFRYIITYLHHKKEGTLAWVGDVEAKGRMWATPGPYLRRSMLITLVRNVSDHFLPEDFYEHTTFDEVEADESVTRPQEEAGMVLSLANRMKEEKEAVVHRTMEFDVSENDDGDDE